MQVGLPSSGAPWGGCSGGSGGDGGGDTIGATGGDGVSHSDENADPTVWSNREGETEATEMQEKPVRGEAVVLVGVPEVVA